MEKTHQKISDLLCSLETRIYWILVSSPLTHWHKRKPLRRSRSEPTIHLSLLLSTL